MQALCVCFSLLTHQKHFCRHSFKCELLRVLPHCFALYKQRKKLKRLGLVCSLQTTNEPTKNRKGNKTETKKEEAWLGSFFYKERNKKQKKLVFICSLQTNKQKTEEAWLGSLFTNKQQKRRGLVCSLQTNKQKQKKQKRLACAVIDTSATCAELVDDITFTDAHCQRQTGSSQVVFSWSLKC